MQTQGDQARLTLKMAPVNSAVLWHGSFSRQYIAGAPKYLALILAHSRKRDALTCG